MEVLFAAKDVSEKFNEGTKEVKMKVIVSLSSFIIASVASANSGLALGSVKKHMVTPKLDKSPSVKIDTVRLAHMPVNYFQVGDNKPVVADTKADSSATDSSI